MNIINYLVSEYKDITKLIGAYFIILSVMIQLNIETLTPEVIKFLKSPLVYFIVILSVSLIVTNDDIKISLICTVAYFVILLISLQVTNFKKRNSGSNS